MGADVGLICVRFPTFPFFFCIPRPAITIVRRIEWSLSLSLSMHWHRYCVNFFFSRSFLVLLPSPAPFFRSLVSLCIPTNKNTTKEISTMYINFDDLAGTRSAGELLLPSLLLSSRWNHDPIMSFRVHLYIHAPIYPSILFLRR